MLTVLTVSRRSRFHAADFPNARLVVVELEEAVEELERRRFDAALVDYRHDGVPARRLLRALSRRMVPTLIVASARDLAARQYAVPIIAPEAPVEVFAGALRAVVALETSPSMTCEPQGADVGDALLRVRHRAGAR